MKPGAGEGGGAADIGMRPGAPLLVHSWPGRRRCHSRGRRRRLLRGPSAARRPAPQGAGKGPDGRSESILEQNERVYLEASEVPLLRTMSKRESVDFSLHEWS